MHYKRDRFDIMVKLEDGALKEENENNLKVEVPDNAVKGMCHQQAKS